MINRPPSLIQPPGTPLSFRAIRRDILRGNSYLTVHPEYLL
jgi:hypothetical protein